MSWAKLFSRLEDPLGRLRQLGLAETG